MTIIDPDAPVKGKTRWYLIGGGAAVIAGILYFVFGTHSPRSTKSTENKTTDNPLESARRALSRETDLETCRSALTQINAYLAKKEGGQDSHFPPEEEVALRDHSGLDAAEWAEITGSSYTPLDAHYLELCFLLRDAGGSLDVELYGGAGDKRRLAPLRQAEVAFDWAVRQVRLEKSETPALPAQYVLRRGWGTALERALVFLELLRHVGVGNEKLTGCLVYCPDKTNDMRLWACGVMVNDKPDLYLFDPRLGLPLPGPNGKGIATLADVRADKMILDQLTVSDASRYDVTAEQAAKAELRYVCSLSALSKRMRALETELLPPAVKVRLHVDSLEERNRLQTASKALGATSPAVTLWQDGGASGAGILRRFLPPEEGGIDATKRQKRGIRDDRYEADCPTIAGEKDT